MHFLTFPLRFFFFFFLRVDIYRRQFALFCTFFFLSEIYKLRKGGSYFSFFLLGVVLGLKFFNNFRNLRVDSFEKIYLSNGRKSLSGCDWCFEKFSRQVSSYCTSFPHRWKVECTFSSRRNEISTITYVEKGGESAFVRARARNSKKASLIVLENTV